MQNITLAIFCILIVVASLVGGLVPMVLRLTHRRLQVALSFVSGVMLGVGLLHLLPHAWIEFQDRAEASGQTASFDVVAWWMIGGFLVMFLLERFLCFHHHDEVIQASEAHDHSEADRAHIRDHAPEHDHSMTWTGAMLGMSVHSILNGMALAAAVRAEAHFDDGGESFIALAGLGTFLVIFLHKPFDALTIGTLMAAGKKSERTRHVVNGLFAMAIPFGALLFMLGVQAAGEHAHLVTGAALAASAGMFLCISLSDVLPELQFHQHDRIKLSAALIAGLALAWVIGLAEGEAHGHGEVDHTHGQSVQSLE